MANASRHSPFPPERRLSIDRRRVNPLLADYRWAFRGRRRGPRREDESGWADIYDARLVLTMLAILMLSGLDAGLTLSLLESGVVWEANPIMRFLIEHDVRVFVNVKTVITAAGLLFMVVASQAKLLGRVRVRTVLHGVLGLYVILIGYELMLVRIVFADGGTF